MNLILVYHNRGITAIATIATIGITRDLVQSISHTGFINTYGFVVLQIYNVSTKTAALLMDLIILLIP